MLTNHLPQVRGDDPAIWRRILVVPFDRWSRRTSGTADYLSGSRPRPPSWHGCGPDGWTTRSRGLDPPRRLVATRRYQHDSDTLGRFLADRTITISAGHVAPASCTASWTKWCHDNGIPRGTLRSAFAASMKARGYEKKSRNVGAGGWPNPRRRRRRGNA